MTNRSVDNKRIAKNTLLLYVRMFLLIFVQLYTVPIVLKVLGVEDYGIYNVVGGIVTMFSFIGGSLASGSQRFIAFELGRRDKEKLKKVFDSTVSIYIILAIITAVLLEIVGYWFLNFEMNIPADRMCAANWIFQLSLFTFLINLISIPYNASVIAHERMSLYAYVSILECILKLSAAIALQYILSDRLIAYGLLVFLIAITIRIIYQVYCRKHFEECRHYRFSTTLYQGKELLIYSCWNMIGSVALISRQQGLNIVINLFFGPLLNAAHSIAQQINGVLSQFINNVYTATRSQITKLYALDKKDEMWNLVFKSSKLAFYLIMLISIPAFIEIDKVLDLWLHKVPPYTGDIARLMILAIVVETLSNQVIGVYQAANKIKRYQIHSSIILLLNIPISYIVLKLNSDNPIIPYIVSVSLSVLYVFSILWNARNAIGLDLSGYAKKVLLPDIGVYVIVLGFVYCFSLIIHPSLIRILITVGVTFIISLVAIWTIGLEHSEKTFIKNFIKFIISHK